MYFGMRNYDNWRNNLKKVESAVNNLETFVCMRCKALYLGPYAEYVFLVIPQILEFHLASYF